jgi:putative FmdB family regulatory protein
MPLYEYECSKCHFTLELMQKVGDPPPKKCPKCGGALKKRLSPPALQFKGSGWYITDYAQNKSSGKEGKKEKKPSAEKEVPSKEPKDTKPSNPSD